MKAKLFKTALFAAVLMAGAVAFAQTPVNVSKSHGDLRSAQELINQAIDRIDAAQVNNNDRLGGHAQRAKDLLAQASAEIKLAAEAANANAK